MLDSCGRAKLIEIPAASNKPQQRPTTGLGRNKLVRLHYMPRGPVNGPCGFETGRAGADNLWGHHSTTADAHPT